MTAHPHDPRARTDLTMREKIVLDFTDQVLHGHNDALIETMVTPDYIQHTHGIGQGRQGLRNYLREVAWKRPGRTEWRPIHILESGDYVVLHKLIPSAVIMDIFRFNDADQMAEHWDVVQALPTPGYDPMAPSSEDFERFYALFNVPRS